MRDMKTAGDVNSLMDGKLWQLEIEMQKNDGTKRRVVNTHNYP